jgi:hypothetical protein
VQPRIEADTRALAEIVAHPFRRRIVDQAFRREHGEIDLVAHLQRVAPVDEDQRPVLENQRNAGGAAESGQPGEALRTRGDIFALVLVRSGHEKTVEPAAGENRAQALHPRFSLARIVQGLEALKHAFLVVLPQARDPKAGGQESQRRRRGHLFSLCNAKSYSCDAQSSLLPSRRNHYISRRGGYRDWHPERDVT